MSTAAFCSFWMKPGSVLVLGAAVLLLMMCVIYLIYQNKSRSAVCRKSEERISLLEQAFHTLHSSMRSLVLEIDNTGVILNLFSSRYTLTSHMPEDLIQCPLSNIMPSEKARQCLLYIHRALEKKEPVDAEIAISHRDVWFDCTVSPLTETSVLIVAREITEQKKKQVRLNLQSYYDSLTGLPNKALLYDRLDHVIRRIQRKKEYNFFVFFIDLNRFRHINETLGYAVGDGVLQLAAKKFYHQLRRVDTVARFGRDEFVILLDDVENDRDAFRIIERIQMDLARPLKIQGYEIYISASIGAVKISSDYMTGGQIIQDAEIAMQRAKIDRQGYQVFHAGMQEQTAALMALETDLRNAVKNDEFMVYYQPIVDLDNGFIIGLEALARWQHPSKGVLPPTDFIPMAEETGLIIPIGKWILRHACTQFARFADEFQIKKPFTLAVNLSPKQFNQEELLETVVEVLAETGMDPMCLKLEVTEGVMLDDPDKACFIFSELKKIGIQLAVDDFGTGYSSLSYLHKYPFDTLKIDRSFIRRMAMEETEQNGIIQAILSLASHFNMNVVAEGIEEKGQLSRLQRMKCGFGQGFYFSKPLDAARLETLLRKNQAGEYLWASTN